MWSINWRWLLHHPSEIVRLDEQLRLKELSLLEFSEDIGVHFDHVFKEVKNHLKLIHNFRCYLYIEATKYFQTCMFSNDEFRLLKERQPSEYCNENKQVNFSNLSENQMTLFLKVACDRKNTENIFKKLIFLFLSKIMNQSDFSEKSAVANVIMSRCCFYIE
jgi:hypothetical protein